MPKRCSIPDCRTSHKQGLMLLCYPKDPWRRSTWLKAVRNRGYEPTNNRLICELHFGPDQWEKLRVDGTKKLKWSGVPDVLNSKEVEAARLLFRAGGANRTKQPESYGGPPAAGTEIILEHSRDVSQTVTRKVLKLDSISVENNPSALSSSVSNHVSSTMQPICIVKTEPGSVSSSEPGSKRILNNPVALLSTSLTSHVVNGTRPSILSVSETKSMSSANLHVIVSDNSASTTSPPSANIASPITMGVADSDTVFSSSSLEVKGSTNLHTNFKESCLPLSCPGHSITVRLPKFRFLNSLEEDLEDVRSFLNENERTYEERLISAVKSLVQKHEMLDKKLQWVEEVAQKNQAEVLDHQNTLLENHKLKQKLHNYESKGIVENTLFGKTSSSNGNTIRTVQEIKSTQQGRVCRITLQEGAFAPLDDQL